MKETPLFRAHKENFKRYIEIRGSAEPGNSGDPTSPGHLLSLCEAACMRHDAPDDKISRWLGFVQGVMAIRGLTSVEEERDLTRPIFHQAYKEMGIDNPPSITV